MSVTYIKPWDTFVGPFDPCPPLAKAYITAPNLYTGFQPPALPQFGPFDALKLGTLWPVYFDNYRTHSTKGGIPGA